MMTSLAEYYSHRGEPDVVNVHSLAFLLSEIYTYWSRLIKSGPTSIGPAEEEAELGPVESHYGKENQGL